MLLARHNYEVRTILAKLAGLHVDRSLEIGCGYGRLSLSIADVSDRHTAIDINESALQLASQTYPTVSYELGSVESIPYPTDTFGVIVSWTVLQHVPPERIETACAELCRVLKPGGTLLLCEEVTRIGESIGHTWHRAVHQYAELFSPLTLIDHEPIATIASVPGMDSPGEVMRFIA